ncbi:MAG: 16S rRNA (uracil(1498)-N(3))-methyltransferase, partial [Myxococcaceae bacterium]|nr:16S rRNA (uracil(1498)-N(3))-methyltransferase [Myxococcaceae bacterium]
MRRLLLRDAAPGERVLQGPGFHHLARVLRAREGDALEVFDGQGRTFSARLVRLEIDRAHLELDAAVASPRRRAITLVQAFPKADRLEWVLQKGTELGATGFWPVQAERCVVKWKEDGGKKVQRWQRIVEEAARQCERADVPQVFSPAEAQAAARTLQQTHRLVLLDEEERERTLSAAVAAESTQQPLALLIGPEGGWARHEADSFKAMGAVPVTLGRQVLRTETAPLAALVVIRHFDGELG